MRLHRSPASIQKSREEAERLKRNNTRDASANRSPIKFGPRNRQTKPLYDWLSSVVDKAAPLAPKGVSSSGSQIPRGTTVSELTRWNLESKFRRRFGELVESAGHTSKATLQPIFVKAFVDAATFPWKTATRYFCMNMAIWMIISDASDHPLTEMDGDELFLSEPYTRIESGKEVGKTWKEHPIFNDFPNDFTAYHLLQTAFIELRARFKPLALESNEDLIQAARLDPTAQPSGIDEALWFEIAQIWSQLVSANKAGVFIDNMMVMNSAGIMVSQPREKSAAQLKLGGQGNVDGTISANLNRRGGILQAEFTCVENVRSETPVMKGDRLIIPYAYMLMPPDERPLRFITWSQMTVTKFEAYSCIAFINDSKGGDFGRLYVQTSMFDEFLSLCDLVDEDMRFFGLAVTDRFQYANTDAKDRFLVFHDKSNKPDTYRFLHPSIEKYEEKEKALKVALKSF